MAEEIDTGSVNRKNYSQGEVERDVHGSPGVCSPLPQQAYRWTTESHLSSLCTAHVGAERVGRGTSSEKVTGHKFNGGASPRVAESLHVHSTQLEGHASCSMDKRQSGLCAEMPTQDYIHC